MIGKETTLKKNTNKEAHLIVSQETHIKVKVMAVLRGMKINEYLNMLVEADEKKFNK